MSDEVVVRVADAEVIRGQDGFSPIFSSEAIPGGHLVRVEDVNGPHEFNVLNGERGKTGATGAKGDKGDPGNYTKPSSGIPKSDLASGVQASLNRADAAIQLGLTGASVGDLVRVAAVDANGKPTRWNHVPLNEITTDLKSHWSGVGMFKKIAVIGDSYASGAVSTDGGSTLHYDYSLSWIQVLARYWGIEGVNYSYGGATTRSMLDTSHAKYDQYGMGAVISDLEAGLRPGLYIIALGFNDCSGAPNVPLGTSADIGTAADTYYGNYSRIITTIQSKVANAKIVCSTGWRKVNGSVQERLPSYNEAVKSIAAHYNLPCIDVLDDKYFTSSDYLDGQPYNHPTSVQHAGMAMGYSRLIAKMLVNNNGEFADFDNDAIICTATTCNENILDNAVFIGGGSQQGGGQFPINQQGKTSYTNTGYGPDRWVVKSQPCTLTADGMTCAALMQLIEKDRIIDGQKYTLTILYSSGVVVKSGTLDSSKTGWQISTTSSSVCWGGIRYNGGLWDLRITGNAKFYAVKLEIGDQQSLIRKVDGVWKLSELPNFQQELAKCQRYQLVFSCTANNTAYIAPGFGNSATQYRFTLPTPITMRSRPASPAVISGGVMVRAHGQNISATEVLCYWAVSPNSINVIVTVADGGVSGEFAMLSIVGAGSIIFDSNLIEPT